MSVSDILWEHLQQVMHPTAYTDLLAAVDTGEIDPDRQSDVMRKAIEAHASYTGVTLTLHF